MEVSAALIQFPDVDPTALTGVCLIAFSILFAIVYHYYFKRFQHSKEKSQLHWQGIRDIFEDKKLAQSEINLIENVIERHNPTNPLHAITTREGFGKCIEAEMDAVAAEHNSSNFRDVGIQLRDIRNALGLDYIPIGKPIFSTREIHVGQHLSIATQGGHKPRWHTMIVQDVDEAYLYVSPPKKTQAPQFEDGSNVSCSLWRDEDARYTFDSRIVMHGEINAQWRLSHNAQKMNRTQDRKHFRMRFEQTLTVDILNASLSDDEKHLKKRKTVTKLRGKITSLSAGGCAIVFQQSVTKNVFLRMEIELPGVPPITLVSKIVGMSNISGGRSLIRTQFLATTNEERDIITRYLLRKQQENLA